MTNSAIHPLISDPDSAGNREIESGRNPFTTAYREAPDGEYLRDLIASIQQPVLRDIAFPRFPPAAMQERIHGHSNEHSLREAFHYFQVCRAHAAEHGRGFFPEARMLDFGSGWGRIVRPFMPQFKLENIFGYEPNAWFCQTARALNPYVAFIKSDPEPPTPFGDGQFDFVTSWSVFSHLPEALTAAWLEEFGRICRPGALLFLTTWGERFLGMLAEAEAELKTGGQPHWYRASVLEKIGNVADTRARYARGEYIYVKVRETYGDTLIPMEAMRRLLPSTLEIAALDTRSGLAQDVFVLRRL